MAKNIFPTTALMSAPSWTIVLVRGSVHAEYLAEQCDAFPERVQDFVQRIFDRNASQRVSIEPVSTVSMQCGTPSGAVLKYLRKNPNADLPYDARVTHYPYKRDEVLHHLHMAYIEELVHTRWDMAVTEGLRLGNLDLHTANLLRYIYM